jgi:hypothetical protein
LIAVAILGLLGGAFFNVLYSGLVLFAKNTAVNATHETARQGLNRLTRDIHASVSVPQLRDNKGALLVIDSQPAAAASPTPVPAPGVSFQNVVSGPNYVWSDPTSESLIQLQKTTADIVPGYRLIVPLFGIEDYIQLAPNTPSNSGFINVFLVGSRLAGTNPWAQVPAPLRNTNSYAITYYTERVMYVVGKGSYIKDPAGPYTITNPGTYVASIYNTSAPINRYSLNADGSYVYNPTSGTFTITPGDYVSGNAERYRFEGGELCVFRGRYNTNAAHPNNGTTGYPVWENFGTVVKYVSSAKPFYIPLNSGKSPDNKWVGVKLVTTDPKSSNRNFRATSTLLDTQIDYRSRITLFQ